MGGGGGVKVVGVCGGVHACMYYVRGREARVASSTCPALPCPALPCLALPCPAMPCPALPCPPPPCAAPRRAESQCAQVGEPRVVQVVHQSGKEHSKAVDGRQVRDGGGRLHEDEDGLRHVADMLKVVVWLCAHHAAYTRHEGVQCRLAREVARNGAAGGGRRMGW